MPGQVGLQIGHERQAAVFAHDLIIGLDRAGLGQALFDHRVHGLGQRRAHLALEITGCGVGRPLPDCLNIIDGHLGDGVYEQILCLGHGGLGGPVKAQLQILGQSAHADARQGRMNPLQGLGQGDVDPGIGVEPVTCPQPIHNPSRSDPQGFP